MRLMPGMLYLISRGHQQGPKSPDSSCDDPIHPVIQEKRSREEETSIQKEAKTLPTSRSPNSPAWALRAGEENLAESAR